MALSSETKTLLEKISSQLDLVGDELARAKVLSHIDKEFATKYIKLVDVATVDQQAITTFLEAERERYITENIDAIDPITTYDILNGVMWPSVASVDTAMVDHPDDPKLNSMRGVPILSLFGTDNKLKGDVLVRRLSWYKEYKGASGGRVALLQADINKLVDTVSPKALSADQQKELLSILFKSEVAAKLWWMSLGRREDLGYPITIITTANPYLGYFIMMIEWAQAGGLSARGIRAAIVPEIKKWPVASADDDTITATIKALQADYKWLQKQKNDSKNKDYYKGWFDKFLNNPASLVNMLVIINERVNLNLNKEFKYSPKAGVRMAAIGNVYKQKFELTLGDN